jgi:drug/metabolite transporter (DMT)-like permease
MDAKGRDWKIIMAFAAVYILWGSTYLGIYYAVQSIPPLIMCGIRFFIVGTVLFIFTRLIQKQHFGPELWRFGWISGLLIFVISGGAISMSEQHLPSGLVSIIASIVPFQMLILDYRSGNARFKNAWTWIGLAFGFTGVIILFYDKIIPQDGKSGEWFSYIIILLGTVGWTSGSLYSKYSDLKASTMSKVCVQTLTAGVMFLIIAFPLGQYHDFSLSQVNHTSWIALFYLVIFGSLIGYFSYLWLLSKVSAHAVSTHAFVNPIVAVFLGTSIAHESFYTKEYVALVFVVLGLVSIFFSRR